MWPAHRRADDNGEVLTSNTPLREHAMCHHTPLCPSAHSGDRDAARLVVAHPEQGWSLLCNGVVLFEDTGEILPDGTVIGPRRGERPPATRSVPSAA